MNINSFNLNLCSLLFIKLFWGPRNILGATISAKRLPDLSIVLRKPTSLQSFKTFEAFAENNTNHDQLINNVEKYKNYEKTSKTLKRQRNYNNELCSVAQYLFSCKSCSVISSSKLLWFFDEEHIIKESNVYT